MTTVQMDFLGLKEFKFDEQKHQVDMVLHVDNMGDVPIQIQLKNRKLDSAKVILLKMSPLMLGRIQRRNKNR